MNMDGTIYELCREAPVSRGAQRRKGAGDESVHGSRQQSKRDAPMPQTKGICSIRRKGVCKRLKHK